MPAIDCRRLPRRLRAVIAGKGLRVNECNESIMQDAKFRARKAVRFAKLSGIWVKRLEERSSECSVFESGERLEAGIEVKELSARLRCLRKRHLEAGRIPMAKRLEELPRGLCHESERLEWELPDPDRRIL